MTYTAKDKTPKDIKTEYPDALLLDIREPNEYADGKTSPEFENRPMGQVLVDAAQDDLPKDKTILVMCRTGGRAGITARQLSAEYDIHSLGGVKDLSSK
jgi:rhodanese-related sulfurtransferase